MNSFEFNYLDIEMLKNFHGYVFIFILVDSNDLKSD